MSNDHYVPQFYLRNFSPDRVAKGNGASGGQCICAINLARRKFIQIDSIKGQCKKAGFHDYNPELEAALGQLEGLAASAIKGVIETDIPPAQRSADHEALAAFAAIQRSRTLGAAEDADKLADRMFKVAYEQDSRLQGVELSNYEIRSKYPVAIPLSVAAECVPIAVQLGLHVIVNETSEEFVTSDNPVVAHNQYCEGVDYCGVLGWNCAGIQVLFPVSPRHLVLLYDTKVYAAGTRRARSVSRLVDIEEIRNLNEFQLVGARESIYFRNRAMVRSLMDQIERLESLRQHKRHITVQADPVANGDEGRELIHQFERLLPVRLCLRGVRVRRNMRRISMDQRAGLVRGTKPSAIKRPPQAPRWSTPQSDLSQTNSDC